MVIALKDGVLRNIEYNEWTSGDIDYFTITLVFKLHACEIGVATTCKWFFDVEDIMMLLLSIEPKKLTIAELEDKIYSTLYKFFTGGKFGKTWKKQR